MGGKEVRLGGGSEASTMSENAADRKGCVTPSDGHFGQFEGSSVRWVSREWARGPVKWGGEAEIEGVPGVAVAAQQGDVAQGRVAQAGCEVGARGVAVSHDEFRDAPVALKQIAAVAGRVFRQNFTIRGVCH